MTPQFDDLKIKSENLCVHCKKKRNIMLVAKCADYHIATKDDKIFESS